MARRASISSLDKLYSSLPYILPMAGASFYGVFLFLRVSILKDIFLPFVLLKFNVLSRPLLDSPMLGLGISIDFVVFFGIYLFVVRNYKLSHFIRFNAMQALLLGLGLSLLEVIIQLLVEIKLIPVNAILSNPVLFTLVEIMSTTIFVGMVVACGYSVYQILRNMYADIPVISEAADYHVRF